MKNAVVKELSKCLADSYIMYLNTQKCHWNVEGPNFHSLHEMFESQYKILADYIDVLAERIRSLGACSPGSFSEFEELSDIAQIEGLETHSEKMIKVLLKGYEQLIDSMRKTIEIAEKGGDTGTGDILLGQVEQHEKTVWMLKSTIA